MLIGLDLDNTIICYDEALKILVEEKLDLPNGIGKTKREIKQYLVGNGREAEWTELQGQLYGPYLKYARPYTGATDCLERLRDKGHTFCIISHKTIYPIKGERFKLRDYARVWIEEHLSKRMCFSEPDSVVFCDTLEEKICKITSKGCKVFVDDLCKVVSALEGSVETYLFSPNKDVHWEGKQISSWYELGERLEGRK